MLPRFACSYIRFVISMVVTRSSLPAATEAARGTWREDGGAVWDWGLQPLGGGDRGEDHVYCRGEQTLGVGAGQMARVDSSRIAVWKAGEAGLDLQGSVVASEALFPFADGLIAAAGAGATAAIQPGGSVRDAEVIAAADERGMAMVFTGSRHFKH